ncbi:ATP-binding response regulator [Butyrivibrio sp. NC2002]|uniref:ATP-binding response regulator n=1 Tax=Butyrivibrio sp. NC2002 TaxID=1410610 RepID=UPI00068C2228|nr:amino acid permease [Butyrivibrio sp. NC2002]
MNGDTPKNDQALERYLSPIHVWALSFGCAVGWGAFVMPGTTFLPIAGPLGTILGLFIGALLMFVIGINYHYLMTRYPDAGGTLTYTIKAFGYDHGFISAWYLILVYMAIMWANASALGLISKYLIGNAFNLGFHYRILGYDVTFVEIVLSITAVLVAYGICSKGKKLAVNLQTFLCIALILGVAICAIAVFSLGESKEIITKPYFAPNDNSPIKQIISIVMLSPWAYVGFESISNSAAGFSFSPKKSLPIMSVALLSSVFCYAALAQIASSGIHGNYTGWVDYIADLPNIKGILGLPTFHLAHDAMGDAGIIILGIAAFAGVMTGLVGNLIAASRLIYIMSKDGIMPSWFSRLNDNHVPQNALLALTGISVLIPFLGRTAIGWIVDVTTFGAIIAYAYTSFAAATEAKYENNGKVIFTGILGFIISVIIFLYFMLFSAGAMSTESYLLLVIWSVIGFMYYRFVFEYDNQKRFGHSPIVWITFMCMIFFTLLIWVKNATNDITKAVVNGINDYYQRQDAEMSPDVIDRASSFVSNMMIKADLAITRNIIIQMALILFSLLIMVKLYSIMYKRERQAQKETIKAHERSKAKTVFLSNMSHDIRTPMNAIIGYINLAKEDNVSHEELKEYLGKIEASSHHLLALINDVLEMSRIESGKIELEKTPLNLKAFFDEIRDLFTTQMSEKGINYSVDTSQIRNEYVYCDKNRLNRMLLNLLSNAYKFTPTNGEVSVKVIQTNTSEPAKASYEIRVKDSGIGMSDEFAQKVFEAFEREKDSTVDTIQGTGLGMSIVKGIVDLMGGTIEVNTKKGQGTEFVINLSFLIQTEEDIKKNYEDEKQKNLAKVDFTGKRVLLVDDIQVNRMISAKLLEKSGFAVETAENGQEAVDKVKDAKAGYYDVILMDIQMPVMDGYEASAAILKLKDKEKASVPIIAMTANAFAEDKKRALDAGMKGHIAKPIDIKNLLDTLSEILS